MRTAKTDQTGLRWAHLPFYWFCHEAAHAIRFVEKTLDVLSIVNKKGGGGGGG